ncbi:S1C family serine protease [Phenylobacterium sp.]|uniref:S1C family serine protease n=1 Tax=Phenylobacterium sp. TaxID=1871053 RepID=UPI0035B04DB4
MAFTKASSEIPDGKIVGVFKWGVICVQPEDIHWSDLAPRFDGIDAVFAQEAKAAGLQPDNDPSNLFADTSGAADIEVGALIKDADMTVCSNVVDHRKYDVRLTIEWQVYSRFRHEVIAKVTTNESIHSDEQESQIAVHKAFAAGARKLFADEAFRNAVNSAADAPAQSASLEARGTPITLAGPSRAAVPISDAAGSVVAIFAGGAMGSGFLVSADGYLLTNAHVVGEAKTVKVRWSDGLEAPGEVIRLDKRRDVALVKTAPRSRFALALRPGVVESGETVFAVGTPLDEALQGTLTKGVVSANRIIDGMSFIQSDVAIDHGNSGGPLLDDKGRVVGIADLRYEPGQVSHDIAFFIPIGDALDFLALKPQS